MSSRSVTNPYRFGRAVRRQSGFTLVELMIVVAVVILLLVIAVPSFAKFIDRSRLKGAAEAIVSMIGSARTASVQRNRDVAISFGGSSPAWCVGANGATDPGTKGDAVSTATACDCTTSSNCTVGTMSNFTIDSSNYNSVTMGTQPSSFTFDSKLGTVSDLSSPSVTLTSPAGAYKLTLTVAPLGQPSLCVPSGSPSIPGYSSC